MSETILVGHHDRVTKVSSTQWEKHLTDARPRIGARLNFMSPDHHRVRNFVVTELPRNHGRPLKPAQIARSLRLSLAQVDELLGTAAEAVEVILKEGRAAAMNRFNRKPEPPTGVE